MFETLITSSAPRNDIISRDLPGENALMPQTEASAMLNWMEHCTECSMPACFTTCEFYTPRQDFKCTRFQQPLEAIGTDGWRRLVFRKWGKLEAVGTIQPVTRAVAQRTNILFTLIETLIRYVPVPHGFRARINAKWNSAKQRLARLLAGPRPGTDSCFVLESWNPHKNLAVLLTVRSTRDARKQFQHLLDIESGYKITPVDLPASFDDDDDYLVSLNLQGDTAGPEIFIRTMDFVDRASIPTPVPAKAETGIKKAKCIIWDLDNTLWKGTLVEDGIEGVVLRQDIVDVIKTLDQRGILHSIASKNSEADALEALEHFGLTDIFLYPQISWNPKSGAISRIQKSLNIGINTFIFVDDQPFERGEVGAAHADVEIIDEQAAISLPEHARCNVPVTEDSKNRRAFYATQMQRDTAMDSAEMDYSAFIKSCEMEIHLKSVTDDSLDRVHELSQRTNQMNFSGNRYSKDQILEIAAATNKQTYVVSCKDKFGDYGTVGFGIVNTEKWTIEDLMFSCRVQAKTVEHHLIEYMAKEAVKNGADTLLATYNQTPKNTPSGKVFSDLGFVETGANPEDAYLALDIRQFAARHDVITIIDERSGEKAVHDQVN